MTKERRDIYVRIIELGISNIRFLAHRGRSTECILEAEHIHNLPKGIMRDDVRDELYYWKTERVCYREDADRSMASNFDKLWGELQTALELAKITRSDASE